MDDEGIVRLFWERSETAISETASKYGAYCYAIAYNILVSREDAEESVSDSYLAAWNAMPPHRPAVLATFLGKITRRLSIDRWRTRNRYKRGGGEIILALEELGDCVPDKETVEKTCERKELLQAVECFLKTLPQTERRVFLCRYWYMDPIAVIAGYYGFTESKVSSMLSRTRKKLRGTLKKEGLL